MKATIENDRFELQSVADAVETLASNSKCLQQQHVSKTCECAISRSNVLQQPYGREARLPKRCKYHRNVQLCIQTVAKAIENKGSQGILFDALNIFFDPSPAHVSSTMTNSKRGVKGNLCLAINILLFGLAC